MHNVYILYMKCIWGPEISCVTSIVPTQPSMHSLSNHPHPLGKVRSVVFGKLSDLNSSTDLVR